MGEPDWSETEAAWLGLLRGQQRLLARCESQLKQAGLPPLVWYDVLWELERAEPQRLRAFELGERTLLAKHNLSRLLDRLEQRGLVSRKDCADDGRGQFIHLNAAGRALRQKIWPVYRKAVSTALGQALNDRQLRDLACSLQLVIRHLDSNA